MHTVFGAMGTEVVARTHRPASVRERFDRVERAASRFLPDSDLRRLDAAPSDRVTVEGDLDALFSAAREMRSRTSGLVDVAVGRSVAEWGYDADFASVAGLDGPPVAREPARWTHAPGIVERDPGIRFDFGGIAKGWTCDRVVEEGLASFVSAGGDLRSVEPGLRVEVLDPWGEIATILEVGVGALATSSVTRRRWMVGSESAHHLIDPRTGAPADTPVLSATVVASTAVEAEAGAKAVLLHGVDGLAWAQDQPWIGQAVVVWEGGSVYGTGVAA